jgi:HEAT repeat protein
LKKLGPVARPALAAVLSDQPSLEMRRRAELLLAEPNDRLLPGGESLQRYRAIQALEWIGDREARELLRKLADGPAHAMTTVQAKAALARLER